MNSGKAAREQAVLGPSRSVGLGLVTASAATFTAKVALAGQELVIVNRFGTGAETEAYFLSFSVFSFLVNVLAASVTMAVLPAYVHVFSADERGPAADVLFSTSLVVATAISALALVLAAGGPLVIRLLAPGFDSLRLAHSVVLLRLLVPSAVLAGICATWGCALLVAGRPGLALLLPGLPAAVTLLGLAVSGFRGGVATVGVLTFAGSCLQVIATFWLVRRLVGLRLGRWIGLGETWRSVGREYWPMTAGAAVMSGTVLVDQAVASLLGSGSVAILGLAQRVAGIFQSVLGNSLAAVVFPRFAEAAAERRWTLLKTSLARWSAVVGGASLLLAAAIAALAQPLVSLVFRRGAFTPADSGAVSEVLRWYALGLPFVLVGIVLPRAIAALRANRVLLVGALGGFVLNIALDLAFSRLLGVRGIALATAVVYLVSDVALFAWLWWRLIVYEHAKP